MIVSTVNKNEEQSQLPIPAVINVDDFATLTVQSGAEGTSPTWDSVNAILTIPIGATGSQGIQGVQGVQGDAGVQGIQGIQGVAGYTWLSGTVNPTIEGVDNDFYINTTSYDYFKKITGIWTLQGNLKGIQGDQGIQGIQGVQGIQGNAGTDGQDIDHVSRTTGNGAAGTTDTYTVWGDLGETINLGTFTVYNGANGVGSGDMLASAYDTGNGTNISSVDNARKVNNLTVETAVPLGAVFTDTVYSDTAIQAEVDLNTAKRTYPVGDETKVGFISVTQAVDLDAIESRVNSLDAAIVLKGTWNASLGTFPTSTQAGESWIVSIAGTVGGIVFGLNDRVIALINGASTTIYASNWHKADYTDEVLSVAGKSGAVTLVKGDVGLGSVDNTSDLNKPISTATQTALDLKSSTSHTHAGVYEPADSTILKDADIGSTVQAYENRAVTAEDNAIDFGGITKNYELTATAANITALNITATKEGTILVHSAENITGWGTEFKFKTVPIDLTGDEVFSYFIEDATNIWIGRVQ